LLASVITLTGFSFLAMRDYSEGSHGCAAAMASNTDCPPIQQDFLSYLSFHLDFLKRFTVTLVSALTALSVLAVVLVVAILDTSQTKYRIFFHSRYWQHNKDDPLPLTRHLTAWLALHETSPTY
jgi:hypothetical protein